MTRFFALGWQNV